MLKRQSEGLDVRETGTSGRKTSRTAGASAPSPAKGREPYCS